MLFEGKNSRLLVFMMIGFLLSCAPVIETAMESTPLMFSKGEKYRHVKILIITANLEKNPDLIDPSKLKSTLENIMNSSGVFSDFQVLITDSPVEEAGPNIQIVLSKMHYTIELLRFPPPPPLGLTILYPFIAPSLLKRNYFKPQITIEGDLFFYSENREMAKQLFISETSVARANLFNTGENETREKLATIALHNLSLQIMNEFLALTK